METFEIPVADVIVRDRIRKDLGDTSGLMISMERVGQLQPIGITSGNVLVFGARRLDAAQRANWETILAVRLDNLTDALKLAQAERDENEERKPFTPSEAVAAGKVIEAIEKPKAQQRKASGKNQHSEPASKLDEGSTGRTDEKVSAAVGMSKSTYRKAKTVVEAAEKPDAPPEVKAAAEEMDRTGKVDPAFRAVKAATEPPKPPDDGEAVRVALLKRLDVAAEIYLLCDSPAGRSVKRSKAIEYHGLLVQTIKGERPAMDPVAEIVLPPPLSGDAFRSKWREWCAYRRAKKKPISKIAAEKQLKNLADVPLADAMKAIDEAIASDYQGVFPKRSAGNGRGRPRDGAGQRFDSDADNAGPGRL